MPRAARLGVALCLLACATTAAPAPATAATATTAATSYAATRSPAAPAPPRERTLALLPGIVPAPMLPIGLHSRGGAPVSPHRIGGHRARGTFPHHAGPSAAPRASASARRRVRMRREVPYTTLDGHNVSLQISERYAPDAADRALVNFLAPLDGRLILDLDSHGPGRLRMELAEAGGPVLKRMDRPSPYFRFSSTICGVREHLVTIEAGARRVRYRLTAYVP